MALTPSVGRVSELNGAVGNPAGVRNPHTLGDQKYQNEGLRLTERGKEIHKRSSSFKIACTNLRKDIQLVTA